MADSNSRFDATRELTSTAAGGARSPQPGDLLKDRYRIEREIGRGGIGVVYLARDERLHGMSVVIKFLLQSATDNAWIARKFMQEAEALTRISHPGVVRVIDRDRDEAGKPFFVMEFIRGRSVRSVLTSEGMDLEYAATLLRQIGSALYAAHCEGVFHRDLKPENIMLETLSSGDEQIKLIDFGIAKVRDSEAGVTTEAGIVAGSLNYIAPEQLSGTKVTSSSDIYALGIVAYEMVTGRRPFNPDSPSQAAAVHQLMLMHRSESIIPPRRLRPSLPVSAELLILNALSFDASRRPQDARQFSEALATALTDLPEPINSTLLAETLALDPAPSAVIHSPSTTPNAARETRPDVSATPSSGAPAAEVPRGRRVLWIAIAVAVLAVAALVSVRVFQKSAEPIPSSVPAVSNDSATAKSEPPPARVLSYWIMMQKDPRRYPGSKPFVEPGEVVFSIGDRVRFLMSSPQAGCLYVFNESPPAPGGSSAFNILFPSPTSNNGSARISDHQEVRVPERGEGFIFDAEEGTEKLWLVWSANPIAELEGLAHWANPQDKGEIKDATQANELRDFLASHSAPSPETKRDEEQKRTILTSHDELLVKLIKLEHH